MTDDSAPTIGADPTLRSLADQISPLTDVVSNFLNANGHPEPSMGSEAPLNFPTAPEEVESARRSLVTKLRQMMLLAMSPLEAFSDVVFDLCLYPAIHLISHYAIIDHVPGIGDISYTKLAQKTNLPQRRLTRLLRAAIARSIFHEPRPGYIAHNRLSAALVKSNWLRYHTHSTMENFLPAVPKFVEQIEKFGDEESRTTSPAGLAFDTDVDCIEYLLSQPKHQRILVNLMKASGEISGLGPEHMAEHYDWPTGTDQSIVDVGGASGAVSRALASRLPGVHFIVQDRRGPVEQGSLETPASLSDRITFQEHDFFHEQPVRNAALYFLRWILHDWPDDAAVTILRQIARAMGPQSRILVAERLVLLPGEARDAWDQRVATSMDVFMMAFNGSERTLEHFEALVRETGEGLEIGRVVQRPGGVQYSLIEIVKKRE